MQCSPHREEVVLAGEAEALEEGVVFQEAALGVAAVEAGSLHSIFKRTFRIQASFEILRPMGLGLHKAWKKRLNPEFD